MIRTLHVQFTHPTLVSTGGMVTANHHLAVGGTKIITGVAPIPLDVLDRGWDLQRAVVAPRAHTEGDASQLNACIPPGTRERVRAMGHNSDNTCPVFSRINGIAIARSDIITSGVDPFGDAGAAAPN